MPFVDTNVLLYAISQDPGEREKAERSNEILDRGDVVLSVQVLQEFYVQTTRATRLDRLSPSQAEGLVQSLLRFPVQTIDEAILVAAMTTSERFEISYWDAAIVEAARSGGCHVVLSEDLNDGQDYSGVRVENPFR